LQPHFWQKIVPKRIPPLKKGYLYALSVMLCALFAGVVFAAGLGALNVSGTATIIPPEIKHDELIIVDLTWTSNYPPNPDNDLLPKKYLGEPRTVNWDGDHLNFNLFLPYPGFEWTITFRFANGTDHDATLINPWEALGDIEFPQRTGGTPHSNDAAAIKVEWPNPSDLFVTIPAWDGIKVYEDYRDYPMSDWLVIKVKWVANVGDEAQNGTYAVSRKLNVLFTP